MFNAAKVAQMSMYFIDKEGGRMAHLKLIKLLYLSDRESLNLYGYPISEDKMFSMPHGPVLSQTLDLINGKIDDSTWQKSISDKKDNEISLIPQKIDRETFDELSDADLEILESTYKRFGNMSGFELRDFTHEFCKEWKDPQGGAIKISYKDVFLALGKTEEQATSLSNSLLEINELDGVMAALK
ncbi:MULTISPECIES: Panacea domain-containing protein [unclassified Gilliamella]|uniref:Panacea domain-containing protein n=1 Tax=unclassified Gilliamella TaxID=2685620 RepID=UPI001C69E38A|nr:Panacea domain-containing protein [Gilliamella sp. ESL0441]QYN43732.1 SocA family protein [Gilliamella sp. ESL0441]